MDHSGAEGVQNQGGDDRLRGWGGVVGLEAWRPGVEPEDPHHCAELEIGKPKAEPEGCMELAKRAEPRS